MKKSAIILAAGEGRRLKSKTPKLLQQVAGWSLLKHLLESVKKASIDKIYIVLSPDCMNKVKLNKNIVALEQSQRRGTADAFEIALKKIPSGCEMILLLYVDTPLIKTDTFKKMQAIGKRENSDIVILTMDVIDPYGYGRIIRDKEGSICSIKEEDILESHERKIKEVNVGVYVFKCSAFLRKSLKKIKPKGLKREKYLTEIIPLFYKNKLKISFLKLDNETQGSGVNNRMQLIECGKVVYLEEAKMHIKNGVTIIAPENTYIEKDVKIGCDTKIYPFTYIESGVRIGKNCTIGPSCRIRSGSNIKDSVSIGNFAEIVRSCVSNGTKIRHFSYIGDAAIGKNVNIGAGTVIANYDGKRKNKTVIKDAAFIGSNTTLIAPITIGEGAVTGAGSVVTKNKNVPAHSVVVGVPAKILPNRRRK